MEWQGTDAGGVVVIAGTLVLEPADRAAFLEAAAAMVLASRAEAGCHDYAFSADPSEPGGVRIFERWASAADLESHFATAHMAEFRQAIRGLAITGRDVVRYDVERFGPLA